MISRLKPAPPRSPLVDAALLEDQKLGVVAALGGADLDNHDRHDGAT